QTTRIAVASDGSITNAGSGEKLFLDSTGNLAVTNENGPPAADISTLSAALATTVNSKITFDDGSSFTNSGGAPGGQFTADGITASSTAATATVLTTAAQSDSAGERARLDVTNADGTTSQVFVGNGG